jgi:hypothetical protein
MFFLIRKSKTLRVSAINKCLKGWYKNYTLALVLKINDDVNKIIDTKDTNFKFKRVYIRKGENDWSPLGVPDYSWRIYLQ